MEVRLADSAGGMKTEKELQPESDQEPKSHLEAQIKAGPVDKVAKPKKTKEEGEGSKKIEEGEASGEVPPVMHIQNGIKEYETLKSELTRLSEENDELKTRLEALSEREMERIKEKKEMEEQMPKGGERFVSMVRKIEQLNREVKNMKKQSELALKKEKERNISLVFKLEKMNVELEAIKAKEEPLIEMKKRVIKAKDKEESEFPLTEMSAKTDSVQFLEPEREADLNSEPMKEAETGQIAEIKL